MAFDADVFDRVPLRSYEDARPEIRSGDLLLCSGNHPIAQIIQHATHSIWSHVAFVLKVTAIDRIMVLESVEGLGVRAVPLSSYIRGGPTKTTGYDGRLLIARHQDFASRVSNEALNRMSRFAVDRLGYRYSNQDIAKITARIMIGGFGVMLPDNLRSTDEFICSEYAQRCYLESGIEIPCNGLGFIAPSDFANHPKIDPICALQPQ